MTTNNCCIEQWGQEEGGVVSLKTCKSCMLVKYCNAKCQRNHWAKHKSDCKRRAAELRNEALFEELPRKEDCPICFLPMPIRLVCCISLPPATISLVPIYVFASDNEELVEVETEQYFTCCGKSICGGVHKLSVRLGMLIIVHITKQRKLEKQIKKKLKQMMKRVDANDK